MISHTKQGVRLVTGMGVSDEVRGTISYEHWVLHLVIEHTRDKGYDLLRALNSAVISHTR